MLVITILMNMLWEIVMKDPSGLKLGVYIKDIDERQADKYKNSSSEDSDASPKYVLGPPKTGDNVEVAEESGLVGLYFAPEL